MVFKNLSRGQSWSGQPLGTCSCGRDTLSRAVLSLSAVPGGPRGSEPGACARTRVTAGKALPLGQLPEERDACLRESLEDCLVTWPGSHSQVTPPSWAG